MGTTADVLIVGAGPVGLTAALLLSRQDVSVQVVDRRERLSVLPRATGVNVRSMEVLREVGLDDAVARVSLSGDGVPFLLVGESLIAPVRAAVESDQYRSSVPADWPSPTRAVWCAQDQLEPLLLEAVVSQSSARVRFSTELVGLTESGGRVVADLRDSRTGGVSGVEAAYAIGADGAHSTVRRLLGIDVTGRDAVSEELSILFRADLLPLLGDRRFFLHRVQNSQIQGIVRPAGASGRWLLSTAGTDGTSPERCAELVRAAVGDPTLEVHVLAIGAWRAAALVADRFRSGRLLLAGDAAHQHTPGGGLGMNSGIQGAHNLAWKLAGVLQGWARPTLLDTYEAERQPLARLTTRLSLEMLQSGGPMSTRTLGLVLGAGYDAGAVVPDGTVAPDVADPSDAITTYRPSARPGQRAPHVWLNQADSRSTLDLFGNGFVLLTGSRPDWQPAAEAATAVPLRLEDLEGDGPSGAYGVAAGGAVLVRPDGYVAARWQHPATDPAAAVRGALTAVTR